MKFNKTNRGFKIGEFEDRYNAKCSLQKSSLATESAIWFGVDDAEPKIMAQDAIRLGLNPETTSGWVEYQMPKEVLLNTRMHLTQNIVKKLLPTLIKFAETGEI